VAAYADVIGARPWLVGGAAADSVRALVERHGGHVVGPNDAMPPVNELLGNRGAASRAR